MVKLTLNDMLSPNDKERNYLPEQIMLILHFYIFLFFKRLVAQLHHNDIFYRKQMFENFNQNRSIGQLGPVKKSYSNYSIAKVNPKYKMNLRMRKENKWRTAQQ